jgi:hypothetical protein
VRAIRLIALCAASCLFAGAIAAAPQPDQIPARLRPALKPGQKLAETSQTSAKDHNKSRKKADTGDHEAVRGERPASGKVPPLSRNLPPAAHRLAVSASHARASGSGGSPGNAYPSGAPGSVKPVGRPTPPLVGAVAAMPSPMDLAAVKQAIELVRKDQPDEATSIEKPFLIRWPASSPNG